MIGLATHLMHLIIYSCEAYVMDYVMMMYEPQANQTIKLFP